MSTLKNNKKGFSLIELLLVMGIIGILIAAFFFASGDIRGSAQQLEARNQLKNFYISAQAFHTRKGTYDCSTGTAADPQCGWTPGANPVYSYYINGSEVVTGSSPCSPTSTSTSTGNQMVVVASANLDQDPTCDEWVVNENGEVTPVTDDIEQ